MHDLVLPLSFPQGYVPLRAKGDDFYQRRFYGRIYVSSGSQLAASLAPQRRRRFPPAGS